MRESTCWFPQHHLVFRKLLNHDGSCPDDKISYAGRMVFYTHASQNLARGLISQGFSESVGWEAARRVCILTCSVLLAMPAMLIHGPCWIHEVISPFTYNTAFTSISLNYAWPRCWTDIPFQTRNILLGPEKIERQIRFDFCPQVAFWPCLRSKAKT